MPEWITPLLRVLVDIPSFGNCSTKKTSCQRLDTAAAIAQPTTPPPIITMLVSSMFLQNTTGEFRACLTFVPDFVKVSFARHQLRLCSVMHREHRHLAWF